MLINHLRSALPILAIAASSAAEWRFSNPAPHGNNILEMALHDGIYWQIGDRGRVYSSRDLDTWIPRETGTTRSLRSLAFFGGRTFISTEAGGILASDSVDSYRLIDLGTGNWLEGIAASPSTLVAVGDNGAIYSSNDGIAWAPRGNFNAWLRSVAFGNNLFVTVGEGGFVATSPDGQQWNKKQITSTTHLNKVEFVQDRFWIVGDGGTVLTNTPGMTFASVNAGVTNTLFAVTGSAEEILIAGDSTLLLGSPKSGNWTPQADAGSPTLAPLWPYYSALWDGRLFLAAGRTGLEVEGFRTNSASPLQWYGNPQPTREWLWSATRSGTFYAACGANGVILTSQDGVDWSREVVPAAASAQVLLGIGGNSNALIAVGSGGIILRAPNLSTNTISTNTSGQLVTNQTSLFGVVWENGVSPTMQDLQAVAATENTFVVGGARGQLFTSANGMTWQQRTSPVTNFLSSASAFPGGWVASGAAGAIVSSPNAVAWTRRSSGVASWIYNVRYVGGKLVAVGENGVILTSNDGSTWTPRNSQTTEWLNDVTFAQGKWWVAGTGGLILTSADLVTWTPNQLITSKSLYAAVTDGQQVVMAGLEGVILRSRVANSTSPVNFVSFGADGTETLALFSGLVDQRFQLERSANLSGPWTPVENLELTRSSGALIYSQPQAGGGVNFFRTRLLP